MQYVLDQILPYLAPSEQAVYLRLWRLTHAGDKPRCAICYEDLALPAHVSFSTLKRVLKKLATAISSRVNGKPSMPPC